MQDTNTNSHLNRLLHGTLPGFELSYKNGVQFQVPIKLIFFNYFCQATAESLIELLSRSIGLYRESMKQISILHAASAAHATAN